MTNVKRERKLRGLAFTLPIRESISLETVLGPYGVEPRAFLLGIVEDILARHQRRENLETVYGHLLTSARPTPAVPPMLETVPAPNDLSELGDILDLDPGKESGDGASSKITPGVRQADGRGYE